MRTELRILLGFPISLFRVLLLAVMRDTDQSSYDSSQNLQSYYDFVVVGSGSSGSVVASRLAEVGWRVLLLEAGGDPPPESRIPGLFPILRLGDADWHFYTEPQQHSMFGYVDRANQYACGRVIGGGSTTNAMMYVRGNHRDYDNWASMGNPGWDYGTVLEYFKKSEDYRGHHTEHPDSDIYHGSGGPLSVEGKQWSSLLANGFLQAGQELGYRVGDHNAAQQIGFSPIDTTTRNGIRESVADSYLRPFKRRNHLQVALNAYATKVLFDNQKRATGIRFHHDGKSKMVFVKREVILSAGAVKSPHLLMLSGLGPEEHLQQHGIPVVGNLPGVGQNLQDHPAIWNLAWTVPPGNSPSMFTLASPLSISQYSKTKTGPLSAPLALEGNAWMVGEKDPEWPDLQFFFMSMTAATDYGLLQQKALGFRQEFFDGHFKDILGQGGFQIAPMLTRGQSRGSITLKSSNPWDKPLIDPNFLSHPDDVRLLVKGIKFAKSIGSTTALKDGFGAKFHSKPLPGCEHLVLESDEYWSCYVRHSAATTYHPVGTCKMGPQTDPYSVVDNRLKVRGVSGLRVIDASIMPQITTGNTAAPCIMIGERGADFIKEDHGLPIHF